MAAALRDCAGHSCPRRRRNVASSLVPLLAVAVFATSCPTLAVCVGARSARGVPTDVQYIACEACEHVAAAAADAVEGVAPPVTELGVLDAVEALCNPRGKAGRWMRSIDLVERGRRLRMEVQKGRVQECNQECATIALACETVVEAAGTTELAEKILRVYKDNAAASDPGGGARISREVKNWLCAKGGPAGVCDRPAPKLPAGRRKGPGFTAKDDKDVRMEDMLANMNIPGMKMYHRDEFKDAHPDGDDEDYDEVDDEVDDDVGGDKKDKKVRKVADGARRDEAESGDDSKRSASPTIRLVRDRLAILQQFAQSGVRKVSEIGRSVLSAGLGSVQRLFGVASGREEL